MQKVPRRTLGLHLLVMKIMVLDKIGLGGKNKIKENKDGNSLGQTEERFWAFCCVSRRRLSVQIALDMVLGC